MPYSVTSPDTYYRRTTLHDPSRPPLEGTQQAEIAIIGGGLAGLTLVRELAVKGHSPVLLEARDLAFGASGRNGGFVTPGFACGHEAIQRRVGAAHADQLFALSLEAVDYVRARVTEAGPEARIMLKDGIMRVRRTPARDDLRREQDWLAARGYETDYLSRDQVQERAQSARYHEALRSDRGFHIHPLNYALVLAKQAEAAGATIHTGSPATQITTDARGIHLITTPRGQLRVQTVVIATGGYTDGLVPKLRSAFVPVATYVMASEPAPDLLATAIKTSDAIGDNRRAGDYYRLFDNGTRLLWGGGISTADRDPTNVIAHLRAGMVDTYPQLKALKFEHAWSGWMSYARHQMPQVGQVKPGFWHLTAFGGHGLNTTAAAARVVAEGITGESDRWQLFAPWGLDWAGGPMGKVAAQVTYHWLKWRDRQDEAKHTAKPGS